MWFLQMAQLSTIMSQAHCDTAFHCGVEEKEGKGGGEQRGQQARKERIVFDVFLNPTFSTKGVLYGEKRLEMHRRKELRGCAVTHNGRRDKKETTSETTKTKIKARALQRTEAQCTVAHNTQGKKQNE
jgi:hypothetical protein